MCGTHARQHAYAHCLDARICTHEYVGTTHPGMTAAGLYEHAPAHTVELPRAALGLGFRAHRFTGHRYWLPGYKDVGSAIGEQVQGL